MYENLFFLPYNNGDRVPFYLRPRTTAVLACRLGTSGKNYISVLFENALANRSRIVLAAAFLISRFVGVNGVREFAHLSCSVADFALLLHRSRSLLCFYASSSVVADFAICCRASAQTLVGFTRRLLIDLLAV